MRMQRKNLAIVNILICLMLMVCGTYHEPVSLCATSEETAATFISQSCAISEVQAKAEELANKNEQISGSFVRGRSPRRVISRFSFGSETGPVGIFDASEIPLFTTAVSLRFNLGANALFQGMLSYIWSQIGL